MILRSVLGLTLIFAVPILVIRAQSYDDHSLQSLLTSPAGCEKPCFMGLRPSISTYAQTARRFQAAENIRFADRILDSERSMIYWRDTHAPYSGTVSFTNNRVTEITIQGFRLQDVWLLLGEPDAGTMFYETIYLDQKNAFRLPRSYEAAYSDHGFSISFNLSCDHFWHQLVTVTLSSTPLAPSPASDSLPARRRETCTSERHYHHVVSDQTTP